MEETVLPSIDYREIARRRAVPALIVALSLLLLALGLALGLPAVYKSRAVVLIEAQ